MNIKGFLLVETAITIALIALLGIAVLPASLSFFALRKFEDQSDTVIAAVVKARDESLTGRDKAVFGVKFFPGRYVLFEGTSYATRVQNKDESFALSGGASANQTGKYPDEIVFSPTGGTASGVPMTIEIQKGALTRTVTFNEYGAETAAPTVDATKIPPEAVGTLDAYWTMDEAKGTRYDSAGSHDFNYSIGTDPFSATGKINKALQMGSTRTLGGVIGNANRDFTAAGWFYITSLVDADLVGGITDQTNAYTWILRYDRTISRFVFKTLTDGAPVSVAANTLGVPSAGTWYFIAGSYNATTKQLSISVNNSAATAVTVTGTPKNGTGALIGGIGDGDRIDEFGIWSKVLTSTELATLYNGGVGTTSPFTGTLGVKYGAFANTTAMDLPPVECGLRSNPKTLYPLSVENSTNSISLPIWNINGMSAMIINTTSTPTITRTLQFRNFKDLSGIPSSISADKVTIDIHILNGFNAQDSTVRIMHGGPTTINQALGTSMASQKTIRYEGEVTNTTYGWKFIWSGNDTNSLKANDNSFGFDFDAKLNGASSTAVIAGAEMTFCVPIIIDCFNDQQCPQNASSTGSNGASLFINDASIGSTAWTNPSNAQLSDNIYAKATVSTGQTSNYLKATAFNFALPASALIQGIVVEWEKSMTVLPPPPPGMPTMDGIPADNAVRLVKDAAVAGDDKSKPDGWSTGDTSISYGSPSDVWGLSWTPADMNSAPGVINNPNFGAVISIKKIVGSASSVAPAQIDSVRMTVYYTTPLGGSLYDAAIGYITSLFK